ncbi:MAG TPA: hypothetical protein VI168_07385 [Croceibacterium sp.]
MTFQPLGYRFELISTLPLAEAKGRLHANRAGWFDVKDGPRGWMVGPLFCLWLSAFDRHGPMVFGVIGEHRRGTRVRGLAGSDLNGVLTFTLLIPLMVFLVLTTLADDSASPALLMMPAVVLLVAGALVYWSAHKDRRQAERLIEFVEDALGKVRPRVERRSTRRPAHALPMQLIVCGDQQDGVPATAEAIIQAVETVHDQADGFLILVRCDEFYMQVAVTYGGFVLEKREGNEASHVVAKRTNGEAAPFSPDEICEALLGYLEGVADPPEVRWEPSFV